jgi:hypothetical protein
MVKTKKKIIGTVEVCFSIEVPEETEIKYVINTIKEKVRSLNNGDLKFNIFPDAEWTLRR